MRWSRQQLCDPGVHTMLGVKLGHARLRPWPASGHPLRARRPGARNHVQQTPRLGRARWRGAPASAFVEAVSWAATALLRTVRSRCLRCRIVWSPRKFSPRRHCLVVARRVTAPVPFKKSPGSPPCNRRHPVKLICSSKPIQVGHAVVV